MNSEYHVVGFGNSLSRRGKDPPFGGCYRLHSVQRKTFVDKGKLFPRYAVREENKRQYEKSTDGNDYRRISAAV